MSLNQGIDLYDSSYTAHSPDNSFLGFVSGVKVNSSESQRIMAKKRDQCLIYGKVLDYWRVSKADEYQITSRI